VAPARKALRPTAATKKSVRDQEFDQIPLSAGVRHLVIVRVPDEAAESSRVDLIAARTQLQQILGPENLVIIMPASCQIDVIPLEGPADEKERAVKIGNPNAKWNI
jgi:hypothetical protein